MSSNVLYPGALFLKSATGCLVHHYSYPSAQFVGNYTLDQFVENYTLDQFVENYTLDQFVENNTLDQFDENYTLENYMEKRRFFRQQCHKDRNNIWFELVDL